MKTLLLASTFFAATLSIQTTTAEVSPLVAQGEQIFHQNCATCHGRHGEKKAFGRSAIINTLDETTIIQALKDRKAGLIQGPGNPVKARLNDEQMKAVAAYLQTQR